MPSNASMISQHTLICQCFVSSIGLATVLLLSGCELATNAYIDPIDNQQRISTASVDAALEIEASPAPRSRSYTSLRLESFDNGVTHGPLYFEDPYESLEGDDDLAWSGQDHFASIACPVRYAANLALTPLTAIVTPPWLVMESDGAPSKRCIETHDAMKPHSHDEPIEAQRDEKND